MPDFLLLILAGLAIGPAGTHVLPPDLRTGIEAAAPLFLAVTVAFLMMEAGIQLSLRGGRLAGLLVVAHTAVACLLTFVFAWIVIVYGFGLSPASATVLSAATIGPSAVVLASFAPKLGIKEQTRRTLLFEGVIANVISFFVVMSVPDLSLGAGDPLMWAGAVSTLALAVLFAAGVAVVWGLALRTLHPREGVFVASLAVALSVYAIASGPLGGNGAVAAFTFGAVLRRAGGIDPKRTPQGVLSTGAADLGRFHSEVSFLVRTFFFLYLGLLFAPSQVTLAGIALSLSLVAVFAAARYPSCLLLKKAWSLNGGDTVVLVGSVSRGLTDILVVLFGISSGLVPPAEATLLASVIVILLFASLVVNGVAILAAERLRAREAAAERAKQPPQQAPG